jgi:hypothetical protein
MTLSPLLMGLALMIVWLLTPGCVFRRWRSETRLRSSLSTAPGLDSATREVTPPAECVTSAAYAQSIVGTRVESRTWSIVGLTVMLVLAASLRFYGLDREGFWGDEYAQVQLYELPLHYTCWYGLTKHAFGPPDFVIGWLVYRLDASVWMCRLPSAVWGVVGVAACFFLVRRLASWREGLVAAALLSVCRMHLVLSQEARPYSICLTFLLVTLILFLRAFEKPTWRRIALYGVAAYVSTLTRSFTPLVFLLTIGAVLTAAMLARRRSLGQASWSRIDEVEGDHLAVRRLWTATLLAGLAALPMLLILILHITETAFSTAFVPNAYGIDTRVHAKVLTYTGVAWQSLLENYGPWVLTLAGFGVVLSLRRWRTLSLSTRCMLAIMVAVGPTFLLIYSLVGRVHYLYDRYNFYLIPIVAALATLAVVPMLRFLWQSLARVSVMKWSVVCLCFTVTLAYPAVMSADEARSYRRRDWQGCAAYLGGMVTPDDVVMVLTEQPFGRTQHRFFGKYEWPVERRPLAEAIWTLAISDSHFERLTRQTGRCYTVIAYPVEPQAKNAYLSHGLQQAPENFQLRKFRGLDLLIGDKSSGDLAEEVIAACDTVAALPHEDESTSVIPLTLESRLQQYLGRGHRAEQCLAQAAALVPEIQADYFDRVTAGWLQRSEMTRP